MKIINNTHWSNEAIRAAVGHCLISVNAQSWAAPADARPLRLISTKLFVAVNYLGNRSSQARAVLTPGPDWQKLVLDLKMPKAARNVDIGTRTMWAFLMYKGGRAWFTGAASAVARANELFNMHHAASTTAEKFRHQIRRAIARSPEHRLTSQLERAKVLLKRAQTRLKRSQTILRTHQRSVAQLTRKLARLGKEAHAIPTTEGRSSQGEAAEAGA